MSTVLISRDTDVKSVSLVTLNRPEAMNSYNIALHNDLLAAIDHLDKDPSVRVIVVTGAGRAFCAGADISEGFGSSDFNQGEDHDGVERDKGGILNLRIFECDTPIIAAINGAAVGIGATMLIPMDIRIASEKSKFAFPFARRGIVFDGAASWFLPRLVGFAKAQEWILKGSIMMADEMKAGGFLTDVVAPEEVLPTALTLARDIAINCSPTSVANNKRLLRESMLGHGVLADGPFKAHMKESVMLEEAFVSADCQEGVQAFLEKRPPQFADRDTS